MRASGPEFRTFRSSSLSVGRGIENSVSKSHNGGIFRKIKVSFQIRLRPGSNWRVSVVASET